jgi:hypothetical protein
MDTITQAPPRLHVDLNMTADDYAQLSRETGAVEVAQTFQIDSQDMAIAANDELKSVKARITKIKEMKKGFTQPAKAIIAQAEAIFDPALNALEGAEKFLKAGLLTWNEERERLAAEARRKAEEEARKARQDAERKAAEEQARAEEKARAEREAAAKAEGQRRKAEAEGNTRAAAAAAACSRTLKRRPRKPSWLPPLPRQSSRRRRRNRLAFPSAPIGPRSSSPGSRNCKP